MYFNLEAIRRYTHAIEFVEHAVTIENTFKEMVPTWEKLLSEDKTSVIVTQEMTRAKAQCVQLYARDLMKYVNSLTNFTMFPISQEDVKVGNWRVDCIILQLACNKVKDHRHLFELMMTNLYCVPSIMFEYSKEKKSAILAKHLELTYPGVKLDFEESKEVCLVKLEENFRNHISSDEIETKIKLN